MNIKLINHEINPSTYALFLAKNSRLQSQSGHLPITNKDTVNVWLGKLNKTLTWQTEGSGMRQTEYGVRPDNEHKQKIKPVSECRN